MEEKFIGRSSLLEVISKLESHRSESRDMLSVYITPQSNLVEKLPEAIRDDIENFLRKSSLGIVSFYWKKEKINLIIFPPFPIRDEIFFENRFRTEQLKEILTREYTLGIILLRLGEYAIGIFEGKKLIVSKCGKRFLRGKHKKGGFSQARFARDREVKTKVFFDEVYKVLRSRFEPYLEKLDFVLYGGARITIRKFQKRDHFMKKLEGKTLDRIIDVRRVSKKALEKILFEVWRTRVLQLNDEYDELS